MDLPRFLHRDVDRGYVLTNQQSILPKEGIYRVYGVWGPFQDSYNLEYNSFGSILGCVLLGLLKGLEGNQAS